MGIKLASVNLHRKVRVIFRKKPDNILINKGKETVALTQ